MKRCVMKYHGFGTSKSLQIFCARNSIISRCRGMADDFCARKPTAIVADTAGRDSTALCRREMPVRLGPVPDLITASSRSHDRRSGGRTERLVIQPEVDGQSDP